MNRLAGSLSPYLLQHQHNPVDWFPWCDEAFELAIQRDVPIFLSVGYAACHWCHVMERESFENDAMAAFLNEHFVSIKVDREERPDIDQIYMNAVQAMTGRGGWPMSVFLNHARQPFYAGTYWPPAQKFGMPGFSQVLHALADAWQNRRDQVDQQAIEITEGLEQLAIGGQSSLSVPGDEVIQAATDTLLRVLDRNDGGFSAAPKFPHAADLDLLLRRGLTRGDQQLTNAAEFTLDKMAAGGIRDHMGGGFARYSVDAKWLVPHFEKMLYDNALLAEVYLRASQVTGNPRHAQVARETLDYLCRDMFDQAGGIHCSEDADSEGVEGKFYVWTPEEIVEVLGDQRGERFCKIYDVTPGGNFEGKNILNLPQPLSWWADELAIDSDTLAALLAQDRERLRVARENRTRPGRDDKVLTSWNSLAIRALALAGAVLQEQRYIQAAERAAEFVSSTMRDDGRLLHAFRRGRAHLDGYVDDYAYTIEAFISLFEATGHARWIDRAVKLADLMLELFEDEQAGGFFYTASDATKLITRNKEWHDGSLVSGNASAAMGLLKLSQLCDREDYRAAVERTFRAAAEVMTGQSAACGALLSALDRYRNDSQQLVLAIDSSDDVARLRGAFLSRFRPHTTLSWVVGDAPSGGPVVALNEHKAVTDGVPTLYRCENFACDQPLRGDQAMAWLATG